jgi:hypothetical protein
MNPAEIYLDEFDIPQIFFMFENLPDTLKRPISKLFAGKATPPQAQMIRA